jgi:tetratricopeptide (TPR) repeat protein
MAAGFDRGFDRYDAGFHARRGREDRYRSLERRGGEVVARAIRWLGEPSSKPWFLWVHLFDAHAPYDPPPPFAARYRADPYDGEIASVDAVLSRLFDALRAKKLFDFALVVVTSDHGEGLGDHGEDTHGVFLYDDTIHVPLLLKLPRGRHAGLTVKNRVGLVDIAPTVLEVAGVAAPPAMQGRSLLESSRTDAPERPSYAETNYPRRAFGWSPLASWRAERFLFVQAPRRELYDVASDPAARKNIAENQARVAARLAADMERFRQAAVSVVAKEQTKLDPEMVQKLAALGYISGRAPASPNGVDPKDRIAVANAVHGAVAAVEANDNARAVALLEPVITKDPTIHLAQLELGIARSRLGRHRDALAPLRKAIELQPDSMVAQYEMGLALFQVGQLATAAEHFEIVVGGMPQWADARFSLASVYARINRLPDALAELRRVLQADPRHFRANLLAGRILTVQGDFPAALPLLQLAVALDPESSEARNFLADDYEQLGRGTDAQRERIRAQQLEKKAIP